MPNQPKFQLHPRIEQDSIALGRFELCQLRLQNEQQYPWLILVPERAAITEIYQLAPPDQQQLLIESSYLAEQLVRCFKADKLNIAAIGNIVPQLHVHHIVRYTTDKAWPAPVWGKFPTQDYSERTLAERIEFIQQQLTVLKPF